MNSFHMDFEEHQYKTWAEIDLGALRRNFRKINAFVQERTPGCRVICVVKADAYGHGAPECARALAEEGADFFAVSCISEAAELRDALEQGGFTGETAPDILILGYTPPENADLLMRYGITQAVFSPEYAQRLNESVQTYKASGALNADDALSVHIKIDTGMNRIGFDALDPDCAVQVYNTAAYANLHAQGIFSHFACADEIPGRGEAICQRQYERFSAVTSRLREMGVLFRCMHLCNSAAIINCPELHLDAVRAGVMLYGLPPDSVRSSGTSEMLGLEPVMKLKSVVSHIHTVHAGDSVSYGGDFTATHDIRVATIPIGYADGFVRMLAHGGGGSIRGHFAPIVGRICMDQCMADITDIDAQIGDTITFFGDDPAQIEHLAKIANTINYELVCLINKRVKRLY